MRRAWMCAVAVAVAMISGTASALPAGPGFKVYTSSGYKASQYAHWQYVNLYRTTIATDWTTTEVANNFQTINAVDPTDANGACYGDLNRVEVWDQGNLAIVLSGMGQVNGGGAAAGPFAVLKVDVNNPANNTSFSVGNNILVSQSQTSATAAGSTADLVQAVRLPSGWGGQTTNNVAVYLGRNQTSTYDTYRFDASGNGTADAVASEFTSAPNWPLSDCTTVNYQSTGSRDLEVGLDGAVYQSFVKNTSTPTMISRITNTGGTIASSIFFRSDAAGSIVGPGISSYPGGIATGGTASKPIIYLAGQDTSSTNAIFALADGDGGGVTPGDAADTMAEVWKSGQNGISVSSVYDAEFVQDGSGNEWLFFSGYNNGINLYALQLSADGLTAVDGKLVASNFAGNAGGAGTTTTYFEVVANPMTVPEPATLALLGTGALGALGWMRRRRTM